MTQLALRFRVFSNERLPILAAHVRVALAARRVNFTYSSHALSRDRCSPTRWRRGADLKNKQPLPDCLSLHQLTHEAKEHNSSFDRARLQRRTLKQPRVQQRGAVDSDARAFNAAVMCGYHRARHDRRQRWSLEEIQRMRATAA
jgi:hypothetical protein